MQRPLSDCLIPISTSKRFRYRTGSWLSASSTASLFLFTNNLQSQTILVIILHGKTHEEHLISKLKFFWPQTSCTSVCPIRGSRVVFASYKDSSGELQKFAMRFLNLPDSQSFINALKESLKDVKTIGAPCRDSQSGVQSHSQFIHSDELHQRDAAVELNTETPAANDAHLLQSSLSYDAQYALSGETSSLYNFRSTPGSLAQSFTGLFAECSNVSQEPSRVPLVDDPLSYLVKNMTSSSFHDMLGKLDRFISDRGGNLAFQIS